MKIEYFGTDTSTHGHYFWIVGEHSLYDRNLDRFKTIPFNPEELPKSNRDYYPPVGHTMFCNVNGFSILAICGSVVDKRPGSKSVFFVEADMNRSELEILLRSNDIANQIITRLQQTKP